MQDQEIQKYTQFNGIKGNRSVRMQIQSEQNKGALLVQVYDFGKLQLYKKIIDKEYIREVLKIDHFIQDPIELSFILIEHFDQLQISKDGLITFTLELKQLTLKKKEYVIQLEKSQINQIDFLNKRIEKLENDLKAQKDEKNELQNQIIKKMRYQMDLIKEDNLEIRKIISHYQPIEDRRMKELQNQIKNMNQSFLLSQNRLTKMEQQFKKMFLNNDKQEKFNQQVVMAKNEIMQVRVLIQNIAQKLLITNTIENLQTFVNQYSQLTFGDDVNGQDLIIQDFTVAIKQHTTSEKVMLLTPQLGTYITKKKWQVRIHNMKKLGAVGIALKDTTFANNFEFSQERFFNHGAYLVNSMGKCFNNYNKEQNKIIQGFYFGTGDAIFVEYDSYENTISFSKDQENWINLDIDPEHKPINAAIVLWSVGDQIQINSRH